MHIERLQLKDVGPFDDVTLEFPKGKDATLADVYLLTGPNGTGKSTVLYALAAAIGGGELGHSLLTPRMRSHSSLVAFQTDEQQIFAIAPREYEPNGEVILGGDLMWTRLRSAGRFMISPPQLPSYAQRAAAFRLDLDYADRERFSWAAFAYAGVRSISDVAVTAIQEPKQSPFAHSLSFVQTADTEQLANWLVSQNFRRLKAKEGGNIERAESLSLTSREIESAVGQIVGDPDFGFVFSDEDDDVRVRWNGVTVRLGLLPDGLKSIVSWIADLLMRLDRIPWAEGISLLQRSFLLLLDEIDIHLHPAWQRKVLPFVQRLFPNAQIIASTHSPFVVASVDDARIITLRLDGRSSVVQSNADPQIGHSYSSVLRSIFGIESEFDIDTEEQLRSFHEAKQRLFAGDPGARAELDRLADLLANRSEELREVIALERAQLQRQLSRRAAPSSRAHEAQSPRCSHGKARR